MLAVRKPLRSECRSRRPTPGRERPERHQRVHVGTAVAGRGDTGAQESTAGSEQDRRAERELHDAASSGVGKRDRPVRHAEHEQRYGESCCDGKVAQKTAAVSFLGLAPANSSRPHRGGRRQHAVARGDDGRFQGSSVRPARIDRNTSLLRHEIDPRVRHAIDIGQRAFDPAGAGSTGHAGNVESSGLGWGRSSGSGFHALRTLKVQPPYAVLARWDWHPACSRARVGRGVTTPSLSRRSRRRSRRRRAARDRLGPDRRRLGLDRGRGRPAPNARLRGSQGLGEHAGRKNRRSCRKWRELRSGDRRKSRFARVSSSYAGT